MYRRKSGRNDADNYLDNVSTGYLAIQAPEFSGYDA
jgi:hypothetical protein